MSNTFTRICSGVALLFIAGIALYLLPTIFITATITIGLIAELIYLYRKSIIPMKMVIFGSLYASTLLVYAYLLYVLSIAVIMDTAGFFIGKYFGKKKLCPEISPNKTVLGVIAGLFGVILFHTIAFNYLYIFTLPLLLFFPLVSYKYYWLLTFCCPPLLFGVSCLYGDLLISKIKRIYDIKDTSNFIPGHGGLWDRFDSLLGLGCFGVVIYLNIFLLLVLLLTIPYIIFLNLYNDGEILLNTYNYLSTLLSSYQ